MADGELSDIDELRVSTAAALWQRVIDADSDASDLIDEFFEYSPRIRTLARARTQTKQ